jgi:carbonic anhydrase/acetyltransferase-like protein (isoleucine patch superfamily)
MYFYIKFKKQNKMEKKYKLTDESIEINGSTLYRIEALRAFGRVNAGEKGGFVESEKNLSHSGNCWIYDEACVFDDARICDDALIFNTAQVSKNAGISDFAKIEQDAIITGIAYITGYAIIRNKGHERGKSYVTIGPVGHNRYVTYEKESKIVNAGCFTGSIDQFEKKVKEKYYDKSDYYDVIAYFRTIEKQQNKKL